MKKTTEQKLKIKNPACDICGVQGVKIGLYPNLYKYKPEFGYCGDDCIHLCRPCRTQERKDNRFDENRCRDASSKAAAAILDGTFWLDDSAVERQKEMDRPFVIREQQNLFGLRDLPLFSVAS